MSKDLILNNNKLEDNKSFGVVFTDLECSLIGGGTKRLETWELYERECKEVSRFIDQILSLNNYFVIVSSSHHDAKERISRKFNFFYNYVSEANRDKLLFFISEAKGGKGTIFEYEDVKVSLIGEKVECVDIVLDKLKNNGIQVNNIVGFGDDEKDVDMLFRIQELGGSVGTIADKDMYLTNEFSFIDINDDNYEEVIKKIVDDEFSVDTMILSRMKQNEYSGGNFFKQLFSSSELKSILEKKDKRQEELKNAYVVGEVNKDTLQRCLYVAELTRRYFIRYHFSDDNFVGYGEELLGKVYSISENYSDKALSTCGRLLGFQKVKQLLLQAEEKNKRT